MNALAIESSSDYLSLALQCNEKIFSYNHLAGAQASQLILPEIQRLLTDAKTTLEALDVLIYGTGPGAFTGVRVAVGVTQGLAFGASLPVIGVSSVQAVAEAVRQEAQSQRVVVCLDARMGEVYHAVLVWQNNHWHDISPVIVCKPQDVPPVEGINWTGVGSGWGVYASVLSEKYHGQLTAIHSDVTPKASAMLSIAQLLFESGQFYSAHEAAPLYVRNRVALTAAERAQGQTLSG